MAAEERAGRGARGSWTVHWCFRCTQIKCGSEPARECAVSVSPDLTDSPHSRAGSLPQGYCVYLSSKARR
ncbi:hypothetical protein PkoCFBP13504_02075 [Pseudomonas koreensis]|nr:hypothetical protein PkoCFBP13504_02075 [Pseudomonas koreensis]